MLGRLSPRSLYGIRRLHTVIGIDLGTTNSAVAVVENNAPRILEDAEGHRTTPSMVAFTRDERVLVGYPARRQAAINPHDTFYATKRLIGRKFDDDEVQHDIGHTAYKIISHTNGDAWLSTLDGRQFPPLQVSGYVLRRMKEIAEENLGAERALSNAVVTVPAYFNDAQRQATKAAGKIVGLNVLRVLNEPTAAALAYGIDKRQKDGTVAVFDLGGGTFDILILDIEEGVFEVRATNGNTHLGGEDLDIILTQHVLTHYAQQYPQARALDRLAIQRVREACERCKIELLHVSSTEINIPFISEDRHIHLAVTESELDEMAAPLIAQTLEPVKRCLRDAELKPRDIDEVLLVGGMTRMPKIRATVQELFAGKPPSTAVNPDEAVALGAAIQGAVLSGEIRNVVLLDVTPLLLGIETYGGLFSPLIPRNSAVPIKKEQMFLTAVDGQTGVEIRVYQGERLLVRDNKLIGSFQLAGIPVALKGEPQIAVGFAIDADGIINVTATDKTKYPENSGHDGKSVSIQVAAETGLTEAEIALMVQDSAANAERDAARRRAFENALRADIVCIDTENAVQQFGKLMDELERREIDALVRQLRQKISDIREDRADDVALDGDVAELQKRTLGAIKTVMAKQQST